MIRMILAVLLGPLILRAEAYRPEPQAQYLWKDEVVPLAVGCHGPRGFYYVLPSKVGGTTYRQWEYGAIFERRENGPWLSRVTPGGNFAWSVSQRGEFAAWGRGRATVTSILVPRPVLDEKVFSVESITALPGATRYQGRSSKGGARVDFIQVHATGEILADPTQYQVPTRDLFPFRLQGGAHLALSVAGGIETIPLNIATSDPSDLFTARHLAMCGNDEVMYSMRSGRAVGLYRVSIDELLVSPRERLDRGMIPRWIEDIYVATTEKAWASAARLHRIGGVKAEDFSRVEEAMSKAPKLTKALPLLITELGAFSFRARESADRELQRLVREGPLGWVSQELAQAVEQAALQALDAEIRRRASQLLSSLEKRIGTGKRPGLAQIAIRRAYVLGEPFPAPVNPASNHDYAKAGGLLNEILKSVVDKDEYVAWAEPKVNGRGTNFKEGRLSYFIPGVLKKSPWTKRGSDCRHQVTVFIDRTQPQGRIVGETVSEVRSDVLAGVRYAASRIEDFNQEFIEVLKAAEEVRTIPELFNLLVEAKKRDLELIAGKLPKARGNERGDLMARRHALNTVHYTLDGKKEKIRVQHFEAVGFLPSSIDRENIDHVEVIISEDEVKFKLLGSWYQTDGGLNDLVTELDRLATDLETKAPKRTADLESLVGDGLEAFSKAMKKEVPSKR